MVKLYDATVSTCDVEIRKFKIPMWLWLPANRIWHQRTRTKNIRSGINLIGGKQLTQMQR
ncbi:hypothetical protein A9507_12310 [Methanobacterium sp. A39]|uniref:Uncharacterized protein n=1 Tax=Methanobacterium bryantii TaxID=2161 RepID=A0A2A2H6U2_METBR|nr:hypothetical protein A9507_12310 [Methanobacterium sp. A39]PAV05024.1 hypothetical protein ASJ80_12025 [Methanobacterium bryantii]